MAANICQHKGYIENTKFYTPVRCFIPKKYGSDPLSMATHGSLFWKLWKGLPMVSLLPSSTPGIDFQLAETEQNHGTSKEADVAQI